MSTGRYNYSSCTEFEKDSNTSREQGRYSPKAGMREIKVKKHLQVSGINKIINTYASIRGAEARLDMGPGRGE